MQFDHRVHIMDRKGKILDIKPYTKVCRMGCPEIYFDHKTKTFFDPGTMVESDPKVIPDDIWERFKGAPKGMAKKEEVKEEKKEVRVAAEEDAAKEEELSGLSEGTISTAKKKGGRPKKKI